jgi:hypothetical protein
MPLGFNEKGTVSSYARGVTPPGGLAAIVHVGEIWPKLPVGDKILIVRGLAEKAEAERKLARSRKFAGSGQYETGCRRALRYSAAECDRVAKLLCEAWGLRWKGK